MVYAAEVYHLLYLKSYVFILFRRGPIKLGMAKVTQVDFPPREIVTYTKETQTPVMAQPKEGKYLTFIGNH